MKKARIAVVALAVLMLFAAVSCKEPHVHEFGDWEVTKEATCTEAGVETSTCKGEGCTETKTREVEALGHSLDKDGKCVRCDKELAAAKIGDVGYKTLVEAINAAKDGDVVTLLWDASGAGLSSADAKGEFIGSRGNLVIDFAGHTYTMLNPAVGSKGTETQAMHWGKSLASVEMKNGTFKVAENATEVKMAMQNYVKFTAKDMEFDFSNITVCHYGANEFKGANAIYNGLEAPMFNNNSGETMVLENCKLTMPKDSSKGISPDDGGLTLKNTIVDGSANLQCEDCKLTLVGESSVKGVVPYFENSGTVEKTTNADGSITYKLVSPTAGV